MASRPDSLRAAELSAILAQRYPASRPVMVARVMVEAVKLARYAKSRAELECNYPMTEENCNRAAKRLERAARKVNDALLDAVFPDGAEWSRVPTFTFGGDPRGCGGDPRGCCGMLRIPGVPGDGWGRDGFPLY